MIPPVFPRVSVHPPNSANASWRAAVGRCTRIHWSISIVAWPIRFSAADANAGARVMRRGTGGQASADHRRMRRRGSRETQQRNAAIGNSTGRCRCRRPGSPARSMRCASRSSRGQGTVATTKRRQVVRAMSPGNTSPSAPGRHSDSDAVRITATPSTPGERRKRFPGPPPPTLKTHSIRKEIQSRLIGPVGLQPGSRRLRDR